MKILQQEVYDFTCLVRPSVKFYRQSYLKLWLCFIVTEKVMFTSSMPRVNSVDASEDFSLVGLYSRFIIQLAKFKAIEV